MGWWRGDPTQWCRSALHRYSRLSLRDDALLRSRCFSKSQPQPAEHKEDDDAKRPAGLSNLEWVQLQHYRRWKRKLEQDPYRVLFGASNDMLNGRGLKEWEWVMRAFPKWMLKGMEISDLEGKEKSEKWSDKERKETKPDDTSDTLPLSDEDALKASSNEPTRENTNSSTTFGANERDNLKHHGGYPRKIDWTNMDSSKKFASKDRVSDTAWTVHRWRYMADSRGVISPSDSRRPPEINDTTSESDMGRREWKPWRLTPERVSSTVLKSTQESTIEKAQASRQEASSRETTFIKEFLADSPKTVLETEAKSKDWRQTVLDRRVSPSFVPKSRGTQVPASKSKEPDPRPSEHASLSWPSISGREQLPGGESPIPSTQASGISKDMSSEWDSSLDSTLPLPEQPDVIVVKNVARGGEKEDITHEMPAAQIPEACLETPEWSKTPELSRSSTSTPDDDVNADMISRPLLNDTETKSDIIPRRSTHDILQQLPEDDLDFLSAEDIRASMGTKPVKESTEEKHKNRVRLEQEFAKNQHKDVELHPVLESKIVNDQQVRRTERELKGEAIQQNQPAVQANSRTESQETSVLDSPIESSLDRMTRIFQSGGDALARHFWQEPTQHNDVAKKASDSFLKGIVSGVEKSRGSMEKVREDLEINVPCSKTLLQRLDDNELSIIPRAGKLARYQNNSAALSSALRARKKPSERVKLMRWALEKTEEEYEEACRALAEVDAKTVLYPSKDRLREALVILQKNVRLSRRMYFGLQARLESTGADSMTPMYVDMGHRLLALRDTQFALLRLVERAMQTFGVTMDDKPKVWGSNIDATAEMETAAAASVRLAAANQKLANEVEAPKSSMQGLSDDGYSRASQPPKSRTFNTDSPLSHSLFRPFGEQFESLGKDIENTSAEPLAKSKQLEEDRALVKEVKKAYEDTYGPITVDHRQFVDTDSSKSEQTVENDILEKDAEKVLGVFADLPPATATDNVNHTSPTANIDVSVTAKSGDKQDTNADADAVPDNMRSMHGIMAMPNTTETSMPSSHQNVEKSEHGTSAEEAYVDAPVVPTEYTIMSYNPTTDEISIMTTTSSTPETSTTRISIPEAFQTLDSPAKFIPHFPESFDIAAVSKNSLVLRASSETNTTIEAKKVISDNEVRDEEWKRINPVDGTTRLSPTGYVGVDDLKEEVARELDAARRREEEWSRKEKAGARQGKDGKGRRRGRVASVLKTAIIASACCYVVGVFAEMNRH